MSIRNKPSVKITLPDTAAENANAEEIAAPDAPAAPIAPDVAQDAAPDGAINALPDVTPDADAAAQESGPTAPQDDASESKAAGVLADETGNDRPLAVPATPTAAQVAAHDMFVKFGTDLWIPFVNAIPGAGGAFDEPDKAALKELRKAYAAENNLDLTDEDDLLTAAFAIKARIDADRAAHAAAAANSASVRVEYFRAVRSEIATLLADVDQLITSNGGKISAAKPRASAATSESDEAKTRKSGIKWTDYAAPLLKWADDNKLAGFYLIDKAENGYKDIPHCVKLLPNGTFEICDYDPRNAEKTPVGTGQFVNNPLYYGKNGHPLTEDNTEVTNIGGPMRAFVVRMRNAAGEIVIIDGVTTKVGTAYQPTAAPDAVVSDAGIER